MRRARKILGLVLGPDGAPLAGVRVNAWGPTRVPPVTSGADGRFTLDNVFPGDWTLRAGKEGLAPATKDVTVPEDRDASVELHMERGGTVEGEVRGLSASELERCQVNAGDVATAPGPDGRFVLHGVPTGTVTVMAVVRPGNRSRGAVTTITDPETPAHVTIDFAGGLTLSGTITRAGLPVQGLLVRVIGMAAPGGGGTATDADGAFTFTGLAPGEYELEIRSGSGDPLGGRHLTLDRDTEVELEVPAGGIEGVVAEADTGDPISGAALVARRVGLPEVEKRASSDAGGGYRFDQVPDGTYAVTVTAEGYRAASATVTVADGLVTHHDLSLEPGEGVVLVVTGADGNPAPAISVIPMAGGIVGARLSAGCDAAGRCRLQGLPTGTWTLLVRSSGAALLRVDNPGPEVPVRLRPTGTLRIAARPGEDGTVWRVRVVERATGLVYPIARWHNPGSTARVAVPGGGLELSVPEGDYTVEGAGPGGRRASVTVTVPAGSTAVADLDAPSGS
ncbi:MAG TPA: PEGA domain-containing protein [Acidobacteria bacterium]|nr:PEGA domain-containing protein [Acidobacteriota bacterium]